MDKRFVIVIVIIVGAAVLLFSFSLRNFNSKACKALVEKVGLEVKESILNLAERYNAQKDYPRAKRAFQVFIKKFPASDEAALKIYTKIEELNIKILFSDIITDDSFSYEIKSGDALAKIASRFNTTIELLKKSNGRKTDFILPGRFLKVNKAKFSILVDRSENILKLVKPDNEIVKTYRVSTGENLSTPTGTFKIEEKLISPLWYKIGAIVEPASPKYELGSRWMGLSAAGYGIHGTNDTTTVGKHITKGCVRMLNEDIEELYTIVPSGTEVAIVE